MSNRCSICGKEKVPLFHSSKNLWCPSCEGHHKQTKKEEDAQPHEELEIKIDLLDDDWLESLFEEEDKSKDNK